LASGSKPFGQLLLGESQGLPRFLKIIGSHVTNCPKTALLCLYSLF
jgi:hypothetical protein